MDYVVRMIGDFLLSAWLWQITFDWFHPMVTGIVMFLMLSMIMRVKRAPALVISIGAQLFAIGVFGIGVVYGIVYALDWMYEPTQALDALAIRDELFASFSVAFIYAVLQSFYFVVLSLWWRCTLLPYLIIVAVSNSIGMLLSYVLTRMVIMWHYVS